MRLLLALLLAQPVTDGRNPDVTIAAPTPGLAAIRACLIEQTDKWLEEYDWQPTDDERWNWATKIVSRCPDGWVQTVREGPLGGLATLRNPHHLYEGPNAITPAHLLRSEATYFVDRLIREHYEAKA